MGSLAWAVGGGLAGAGAGLADVGRQELHEMSQQKLLELRMEYEQGMHRSALEAQKNLETQRETYETGRQERGFQVSAAAAAATRGLEADKLQQQIKARHEDVKTLADARKYAAGLRASNSSDKPPTKDFKSGTTQLPGLVPDNTLPPPLISDPKNPGQRIPDPKYKPPMKSGKVAYRLLNHASGTQLIQLPNRGVFVLFNGRDVPAEASVGRAPLADVRDVVTHPERYGDFLKQYGYLPKEWESSYAAQYTQRLNDYNSRHGSGAPAFTDSQNDEQQDTADLSDAGYDSGSFDPYGTHGTSPTSQPSDNEPAQ